MTRFAPRTLSILMCAGFAALAMAACTAGSGADSAAEVTAPVTGATSSATSGAMAPNTSGPLGVTSGSGATDSEVSAVEPSIVKTARLSLEVGEDGFAEAADRATSIAGEQGGYVESSSSQGSDVRSGSLTLRIPVDHFEAALTRVSQLGDIRLRSVSGKDVTSKFVDLEARIRNAKAQEEVLLGILHQATTVTSTLQVQRTLSDTQLQIEQLVGQERALRDRAAYGTIVLSLFEIGPKIRHAVVVSPGVSNPELGKAWRWAKAAFFGLLYGIIASAGILIPLALIGLVALLVWRRTRTRRIEPAMQPEA